MTRSFFIIVIFLALSCQINEKSEKRYNYLALGDSYTIAESLNLIDSYPEKREQRTLQLLALRRAANRVLQQPDATY